MAVEFGRRESAVALLRSPRSSVNAFEVTVERLGSAIKMGLFGPGEQLKAVGHAHDMEGALVRGIVVVELAYIPE